MNNAGIMLQKNLKVPAADLDGLMAEVNIDWGGVIRTTSAFIDLLVTNKGTVINVSSALAFVPLPSARAMTRCDAVHFEAIREPAAELSLAVNYRSSIKYGNRLPSVCHEDFQCSRPKHSEVAYRL